MSGFTYGSAPQRIGTQKDGIVSRVRAAPVLAKKPPPKAKKK